MTKISNYEIAFGYFRMLFEDKTKRDSLQTSKLELFTILTAAFYQSALGLKDVKKLFESQDFKYDAALASSNLPATHFIHYLAFKLLEENSYKSKELLIHLPSEYKTFNDCDFFPDLKGIFAAGLDIIVTFLTEIVSTDRRTLRLSWN